MPLKQHATLTGQASGKKAGDPPLILVENLTPFADCQATVGALDVGANSPEGEKWRFFDGQRHRPTGAGVSQRSVSLCDRALKGFRFHAKLVGEFRH